MPWCGTCDHYLAPPAVNVDGTCPACGRAVDAGGAKVAVEEAPSGLPWHLKLMLAALAIYLGYRAWEGIAWLFERMT